MGVVLQAIDDPFLLQVLKDVVHNGMDIAPGQPIEPFIIDAAGTQRRDDGQTVFLAELEVFGAASWRMPRPTAQRQS